MIPADAVAQYLAAHGWPDAEHTMAGIRGTGRVLWLAPTGDTAERAGDHLVGDWLDETQDRADAAGSALGVLVTPREDYGPSRVASWWAHLDVPALARLMSAGMAVPETAQAAPVRMHLSTAVVLLRAAGLGEPLPLLEVGQ